MVVDEMTGRPGTLPLIWEEPSLSKMLNYAAVRLVNAVQQRILDDLAKIDVQVNVEKTKLVGLGAGEAFFCPDLTFVRC